MFVSGKKKHMFVSSSDQGTPYYTMSNPFKLFFENQSLNIFPFWLKYPPQDYIWNDNVLH